MGRRPGWIYFVCAMAIRKNARRAAEDAVRDVLDFLNALPLQEQRTAAVTILLHAGRGQAVDEFVIAGDLPESRDQLSAMQRFRLYVEEGKVDFSRIHRIDGRYFGFETEHSVYPYVGYGTREYMIPGVCVSDVLQGVDISPLRERGIGDDSTLVFAGRDAVRDGRRVSAMHDSLLPLYRSEERVSEVLRIVEDCLHPVFSAKEPGDYIAPAEFSRYAVDAFRKDGRLDRVLPSAPVTSAPEQWGRAQVVRAAFEAWSGSLGGRLGAGLETVSAEKNRAAASKKGKPFTPGL
ncbi:MAG: hypothetical protein IJ584_02915 [Bacteroidales bacterium]|nr:hypothetical protein [Bacteroidales bacterium]